MEKIIYIEKYDLKETSKSININDIKGNDFVHIKGRYSFDGEDNYGKSTGWEHVDYDIVNKIKFDTNMLYDDEYKKKDNDIIFKSKEALIKYVAKNSRLVKMFEKKHIDYTFYKEESIAITKKPKGYEYYCDKCNNFYSNYDKKLVKNNKHTSMKIMKDGTHKCFECCNIGRHLPSVVFSLEINSQIKLDELYKILKKNSWIVEREDDAVLIKMILKDKVNYVVDMIADLNKKASLDLKFEKKEKFYNPKRSEIIYYYKMRIK